MFTSTLIHSFIYSPPPPPSPAYHRPLDHLICNHDICFFFSFIGTEIRGNLLCKRAISYSGHIRHVRPFLVLLLRCIWFLLPRRFFLKGLIDIVCEWTNEWMETPADLPSAASPPLSTTPSPSPPLLCHTTKGCTLLWQPIKKLKHTNLNFTMHKNRNDKAYKHTHNTMTTRGCQCQVPPKDLCRCGISALHRHCRSFSSYQRPSRGVINADLRTLIMIWFDQNGKSTETSSSWDCLGGKRKTRKLSVSEL